jgi:phosphatidylserine/phosphatidylglycerophosphate/cardiolipin synthase-like enzyme
MIRGCIGAVLLILAACVSLSATALAGTLKILPEAGRSDFLKAFAEARFRIRIEICVLEDPQILAGLQQAIERGVRVQVIVDNGKYQALPSEQTNLTNYIVASGGELHLSNPIFPRSFPKVILIDDRQAIVGSACLDTTTFQQYRDYFLVTADKGLIRDLATLFENDWRHSAAAGAESPPFNPTPWIIRPNLAVGPVNAASKLTAMIQSARKRIDVTSELLGNAALESELIAAVGRGVTVRLISPLCVNGATNEIQSLQNASLRKLKDWGVEVHVTGPDQSFQRPYMHARTMLVDGSRLYVGSISFSPDSTTFNREVGLFLSEPQSVRTFRSRFDQDFASLSTSYALDCPVSP